MKSQKLLRIREEVLEALRRLGKELDAEVYLFGSYARGTYTLYSDVDIVVVSKRFEGIDYLRRIELVRLKLPENIGFDIIALTPKEMKKAMHKTFFRDISRYWIRIV